MLRANERGAIKAFEGSGSLYIKIYYDIHLKKNVPVYSND